MDDRQMMRASDSDRQQVVDRMRAAMEDGRLKMDEYVDRMGARTRRGRMATSPGCTPTCRRPRAEVARRGAFAELPTALKVLWTIWLVPVAINIAV